MSPLFALSRSLKARLTLFTLGIFVLSIWALSFYISRMLQSDMERLLGEQQYSTVSIVASTVNEEMKDRLDAVKTVAGDIDMSLMGNPEALQLALERRPVFLSLFNGGVNVLNLAGTTIGAAPRDATRLGVNYMDRDYVVAAFREGKTLVGRPVMGKLSRAPIFTILSPVRNAQGTVIGAVMAVTNLGKPNFLDKITKNPYGKSGGYLVIAPQYRQIVTATDKKRVMEVLPADGVNRFVDRNMAGYEGYSVLVNALGEEQLASVKQIPSVGWYLLLGTPTTEAFEPIQNMRKRIVLATLLLTLLAGGLTWWMLRRQLSPLLVTADAMVALSNTNQTPTPLPVTGQDELGQLTGGFNRLIENWTRREDALKKSEQNLSITLNSIGDAVIATDQMGHISGMNPTAERLSGWSLADAMGRPLAEVFRIINAETRETLADPAQLVMKHGQVVSLANHTVLLARQGQEYQIADSAAPIRTAAGDIVGVVLVFSDVSEKYRAKEELLRTKAILQAAMDQSPAGIAIADAPDGKLRYVNDAGLGIRGGDRQSLVDGVGIEDYVASWKLLDLDGKPLESDQVPLTRAVLFGETNSREFIIRRNENDDRIVLNNAAPVRDSSGKVIAGVVVFADITERKQAEEALLQERALLRNLIDAIPDLIFIKDKSGVYLECNKASEQLMGLSRSDQIGKTDFDFFDSQTAESIRRNDLAVIAGGKAVLVEEWVTYPDGKRVLLETSKMPLFGAGGQTKGLVGICRDITERQAALELVQRLAITDPLTGLPNRRLLMDRLEQSFAATTRTLQQNALLFIDLDDFKTVNDTLGHDKGDLVLQEVAKRMLACVREVDTVARLSGDEFVLLLRDLDSEAERATSQAQTVAAKIHATLNQPYHLDGVGHHCSASIGGAIFGGLIREEIAEPLKRAELAMYQAKATGRNALRFFEPEMRTAVTIRASLEADLREALTGGQLFLCYQPQVGHEARISGVEVLLRWQHPRRGLVSPAEFIPVAEASGLILHIGRWVLETACTQLAAWESQPELSQITMAVNVSAREFRQPDFVEAVMNILDMTGARAKRLKIELTESVLVDNVEQIIVKMSALKARGIAFSIDDFGTGYSSLSYLKRLPLDELKIDRSFIKDILTEPNDAAIAKMVIVLAESLGLEVVAEGVEHEAQKHLLANLGCDSYQGFLLSKPLPIEEFEAFFLRNSHLLRFTGGSVIS